MNGLLYADSYRIKFNTLFNKAESLLNHNYICFICAGSLVVERLVANIEMSHLVMFAYANTR